MANAHPRQLEHAPNGWYGAVTSRRLRRGRTVPFRALGRDLVVWRGHDGVAHVIDRYCPHQGAALDKGRVQRDRLVCPFHAWQFEGSGRCMARPAFYKTATPRGARLGAYPTTERHGVVWFHSDPTRTAAEFPCAVEDLGAGWGRTYVMQQRFRGSQMSVMENTMDISHLAFVHRKPVLAGEARVTRNDSSVFRFESQLRLGVGRRDVSAVIDTTIHDGTLVVGTLSVAEREVSRWLACATPDGDGGLTFLQPYAMAKLEGWWRLANPLLEVGMGTSIYRGVVWDAKIWSEQSREEGYLVTPEERTAQEFRRHYAALLRRAGRERGSDASRGPVAHSAIFGWGTPQAG